MVTCRGKSKDKRLTKSNAYRCNELTVLAPFSRVISYVRSQSSWKNNSKDFAAIITTLVCGHPTWHCRKLIPVKQCRSRSRITTFFPKPWPRLLLRPSSQYGRKPHCLMIEKLKEYFYFNNTSKGLDQLEYCYFSNRSPLGKCCFRPYWEDGLRSSRGQDFEKNVVILLMERHCWTVMSFRQCHVGWPQSKVGLIEGLCWFLQVTRWSHFEGKPWLCVIMSLYFGFTE